MLIVCPNCATSYRLDPEILGDSGRSVRCTTCHNLWFEQPAPRLEQASDASAGAASPDPIRIRPPLDDVVDIGATHPVDFAAHHNTLDPLPDEAAPPLTPSDDPATTIDAPRNIERFATRVRPQRPAGRRRLSLSEHALPAVIGTLVLAVVCLLAARQQVVRFLPQTASLYAAIGLPVNLRGLVFENVQTSREVEDGVPVLVVAGDIVGTTGRHTEVPRLRLAVTDHGGQEIYAWVARPSRNLLPPGETLPFRARLASPPPEASGVTVRFFNRRDAHAGFM